MPKNQMTMEEREARRLATNARQRAYSARQREYRQAREDAEKLIEAGSLQAACDEADRNMNIALEARQTELRTIDEQIAALQAVRAEAAARQQSALDVVKLRRDAAWNNKRAAQLDAENKLKEQFSDVAGCYSVASWKPVEDFLQTVTVPSVPAPRGKKVSQPA